MEFWGDLIREIVNKGLIILSITTVSSSSFYVIITVEYKVIAVSVPGVLNHIARSIKGFKFIGTRRKTYAPKL